MVNCRWKFQSTTDGGLDGDDPTAPHAAPANEPARGARTDERFVIRATGDAAKNYDFASLRPPAKTTSVVESIGHLVKGCLGGGVVAIHESYKACGLWTAVVLNVVLGMLLGHCILILVRSMQRMYGKLQIPTMSYPDLAEASLIVGPFPKLKKFSRCFRYAVDITIGFDLFGACCVYLVIIARTVKQLYLGVNEFDNNSPPNIRLLVAILFVPVLCLCMIRSLKYLAPFSLLADFCIISVAIATIVYGTRHATRPPSDFPVFKSLGGMVEFMGVCIFSMEGVGVSCAIENNMTEPKKFPIVLVTGMTIVCAVVMTVGFFGYWGWDEAAKSPVTLNFPMETFPIVLKVFMGVMIYVTFALNFWVPFNLCWFYIKPKYAPESYWFTERIYRAIMVALITLIAITFPNISAFLGLLGSFSLSNMGFIYPAFIEFSLNYEDPGLGFMKWRLFKFIFICLFGVMLCVIGSVLNGRALIASMTAE